MAQSGYTPILIYASGTATNVPLAANMTSSASGAELALNYTDGKLYYKDNAGVVKLLASNATSAPVLTFSAGTTGFTPSTATSGAITLAGTLATTNGGTGLTSFTANGVVYASSTSVLTTGSALVFDGSNLGLGVTPSANSLAGSGYRNLEIGSVNGYGVFAGSYEMYLLGNAYYNSGWKYANSSKLASRYQQYDGNHAWFNAASGTAGNTITFTQAMTLDASGNLGVGTTSPAYPLQVAKGNPTNGYLAVFGNTTPNGNGAQIAFDLNNVAATAIGMPSNTNALAFYVNSNTTERARIDSSGNLGIGTTSPLVRLHAKTGSSGALSDSRYIVTAEGGSEAYLCAAASGFAGIRFPNASSASQAYIDYTHSSNHMAFGVNNGERARIDSSGNFRVGVGTSTTNLYMDINHATGSSTGSSFFVSRYNGSQIGDIAQVGTNAVIYNTASDYRLKIVIGAVSGAGERIDSLKPVDYQWKEDGQSARGFLAHEFAEVYANSVTGTKDAIDSEGNPKYQAMQAGTSEVIADLVAELQSLRKRLAALESK